MKLSGVLDAEQVATLWQQRETLFAHAELDLEAVSQVDSAGLAFLVKWAKFRQQVGGKLRLHGVTPRLSKLVELYAVEPLFDLQMRS